MPTIARSPSGKIIISMNFSDHNPPHFHAQQGRYKALVDIRAAVIIKGTLPRASMHKVLGWCVSHTKELLADWNLARKGCELNPIEWTID